MPPILLGNIARSIEIFAVKQNAYSESPIQIVYTSHPQQAFKLSMPYQCSTVQAVDQLALELNNINRDGSWRIG